MMQIWYVFNADTRYKGKLLEVTGRVGEIKKNIVDDLYVTLGTGNYLT